MTYTIGFYRGDTPVYASINVTDLQAVNRQVGALFKVIKDNETLAIAELTVASIDGIEISLAGSPENLSEDGEKLVGFVAYSHFSVSKYGEVWFKSVNNYDDIDNSLLSVYVGRLDAYGDFTVANDGDYATLEEFIADYS
jgi:hypothetical protein